METQNVPRCRTPQFPPATPTHQGEETTQNRGDSGLNSRATAEQGAKSDARRTRPTGGTACGSRSTRPTGVR